MNLAPVLISAYNRPVHLKKCIESLKKCEYSKDTHLFIAIDASYRKEDVTLNKDVIKYSKNITGFREVTLFIREKNLGAKFNVYLARDEIFKIYDRLVVTEDDNIFSSDFLNFMNKSLELYKDEEGVFSVCGYSYPFNKRNNDEFDFYFSHLFSAWGFGIWRDKFNKINWDKNFVQRNVRSFLKKYIKVWEYNKTANHLVINLINMMKDDAVHGDAYVSLYQYLNKKKSVFPYESRVRNIGYDGSGIHCEERSENNIYSNQKIYSGDNNYYLPVKIEKNKKVEKKLKKHFKRSFIKNIYTFVVLFLFNFNIIYKKKKNESKG